MYEEGEDLDEEEVEVHALNLLKPLRSLPGSHHVVCFSKV